MKRRKAEINVASYNFWELDESKMIHVEYQDFTFSDNTLMFTPHRLPHFVLRWIKKGSGIITVDHIDYQVKPNTLFVGHPDQVRLFDVEENVQFESVFIAFTKDIFALMNIQDGLESLIGTLGKTPVLELEDENKSMVEDLFRLMLQVKDYNSAYQSKMVASLLQILILIAAEINASLQEDLPVRKQTYINLYREFLDQLNNNYKKYHFTSDYADLMFIPLKRLNRACKSVTGKTAGKIIADRLDFEAKRYLYYSSNTVKEISYELGFSDPTYFIKFFRTMNGIAPKAFRQKISKFT